MTPLPKRRFSTRRQGKKRATLVINSPRSVICPKCQKPTLTHTACPSCGFYRDKLIKSPPKPKRSENSK